MLSELPKMQNTRSFAVNKDTDIDEIVHDKIKLHDGTVIHRFFKELLACLKTLAFSPFYKANDPRAAGPMDTYYTDALQAYSAVSYDRFHAKLANGMKAWYTQFPPHRGRAR